MPELNPEKHYLGKLCKHGHEYLDSGKSLKYKSASKCVQCVIKTSLEYYKKTCDCEENKLKRKKYRENNLERILLYQKKWWKKNRKKLMPKHRKYYKEHREEAKSYAKKNHEKISKRVKIYRKENSLKIKKQDALYNKKHREKNREKLNTDKSTYNAKQSKYLKDPYIKTLICNQHSINRKDITPEMIGLKRTQIKFRREIEKGKEALNEIYQNM